MPKTTNKCISLRWLLTTKQTPDGIIPKAYFFSICAQNDCKLHSIDIKTVFLQDNQCKLLTRDIFIIYHLRLVVHLHIHGD